MKSTQVHAPRRLCSGATVSSVAERVAELRYRGAVHVRPYRHGTYLGGEHLEQLIERALGARYSYGQGWSGFAVVSIELYEQQPKAGGDEADGALADVA
jgi:hypothetical protein